MKLDFSKMPIEIVVNLQNPSSIAILFTLLSFGIKNIKISSGLSVYLTNCILRTFGEKYNLSRTDKNKAEKTQVLFQNLQ
jgi:hydroxylamine reductase (hybrid-cluster protein)